MRWFVSIAATLMVGASAAQAPGQIQVKDAWARPGQSGTGAYMTLMAPQGAILTGVATTVAGVAELHRMILENNVMKMDAVSSIPLPAGREVQLKSGGYHVMLMDLKKPLNNGDQFTLQLQLVDTQSMKTTTQSVDVFVRGGPPQSEHRHNAHGH